MELSGSHSKSVESSHKRTSKDKANVVNSESADEFYKAKAYLMKSSTLTNSNVYDHLVELIGKILEGRPENIVDYVEELSIWIKKNRLQYKEDTLLDSVETSTKFLQALKDKKLLQGGAGDITKTLGDEETLASEDEAGESSNKLGELEALVPNLQNHFYFLEQAGITINRDEVYRINLSIIKLIRSYPIYKIRFWGKIIGIEKNYVILETEFHEGDELNEMAEKEAVDSILESRRSIINEFIIPVEKYIDDEEDKGPPLPKPKPIPQLVVESEPFRFGSNQKVYFAAVAPEFSWVKLPLVTPMQISTARVICKYFTGRFDAPIMSYPPFPGNEMHYLRAQIARISASTQISPSGYYTIDPDDEFAIFENDNYEIIPVNILVQDLTNNWVHHSPYLLPQGRCSWIKPKYQFPFTPKEEEEDEEGGSSAPEPLDELNEENFEPETGPQLLSLIAEDSVPEGFPLWTAQVSPTAFPHHAVAVMKSLLWPGAYAISRDRKLANVYIGYGVKYTLTPYMPQLQPPIMSEYPVDEDILEVTDPSPEEEAIFKHSTDGSYVEGNEEEEEIVN